MTFQDYVDQHFIAPTRTPTDTSDAIATTKYVTDAISAALGGGGGSVDFNQTIHFGGGLPYVDVMSGAHGVPAAVPGGPDCTAAIQGQIDYMASNYAGGAVLAPMGVFHVSNGGVIIKDGVQLIGSGQNSTIIRSDVDSKVVSFHVNAKRGCAMENIFIVGHQNQATIQPACFVGTDVAAIIRDCTIWFGSAGLHMQGSDGYVENCFIMGCGIGVLSNGANWYIRDKIDWAGAFSPAHGFYQAAPAAGLLMENHFSQCDFSGPFTDSAVTIADGSNTSAVTFFEGCVFSSPIKINQAKATNIANCELGSTVIQNNSTGPLIVVGNYGFPSIAVTGSGPRVGAGNYNVTV